MWEMHLYITQIFLLITQYVQRMFSKKMALTIDDGTS
jgi:hypothetical protein